MKNTKEKREFLFQVEVKRASDGKHFKIKYHVVVELEWKGNQGNFVKIESPGFSDIYPKMDVIDFPNRPKGNKGDFRFRIKLLEVKKGFFKDKVIKWELEPIQDEISEKIITYWGDRVDASQYRASGFLIVGIAFAALIGGVLAWLLRKKKRK